MSGQSNKKLVLGGAGLVIAALVWFFVSSGSADVSNSPSRQPTVTMTEDEPAEPVARSEPRGSTGGARVEGVAAAVEVEDDKGATQKSKSKRSSKKRQRRNQEDDEEEEKKAGSKKGKIDRYFGK